MKRTLSVAMVFILVFFSAQSVFASTEDANIEEHLVTPNAWLDPGGGGTGSPPGVSAPNGGTWVATEWPTMNPISDTRITGIIYLDSDGAKGLASVLLNESTMDTIVDLVKTNALNTAAAVLASCAGIPFSVASALVVSHGFVYDRLKAMEQNAFSDAWLASDDGVKIIYWQWEGSTWPYISRHVDFEPWDSQQNIVSPSGYKGLVNTDRPDFEDISFPLF